MNRIFDLQVLKLIDSVYKSDFESIDRLCNNGFKDILNYSDPFEGKTALITSVLTGNHDMAQYLIKLGSDPNAVDSKKRTALMFACQLGDFKMTEVLCSNNSNVNLVDSDLKSPLIHCFVSASQNHFKCLETLLKNGADCNQKLAAQTPFLIACQHSRDIENVCKFLVSTGKADNSIFDEKNGNFALHYSAINGTTDLCYLLLKNGSDPNCLNFSLQTPAHFAAQHQQADLLKILWSFGANLEASDPNGDNAMNYAFKNFDFNRKNENFKVAKFLCSRGALPFYKNSASTLFPVYRKFDKLKLKICNMTKNIYKKYSSLYSTKMSDSELTDEYFRYWMLRLHDTFTTVLTLIEQIYDNLIGEIKVLDRENVTFFLKNVNSKIPHIILDRFFDLISNNFILDKARLFDTRVYKALSAAKFHLNKGLKLKPIRNSIKQLKIDNKNVPSKFFIPKQQIDLKGPHFQTKSSECTDPLRLLDFSSDHVWSNDAKWYLTQGKKSTIELSNLINKGDSQTLEKILSKKSAQEAHKLLNLKDMFYKTPLMIAVVKQHEKMIELLLSYDIEINATDNFIWTALHHAVLSGNLDIVKKLIMNKADIQIKNIGGRTALELAVILNEKSIEKYLRSLS
ncbi:ankyrin repeat and EF-hand domain-containing 1 [Brachionus plicatilis]|uniref:Ankyrin repeat and EF-hand domain-containing 1 n=1 Tax=Brachionus plicatilis TaxID=10195 RepID=A0A3M7SH10_BRAPC|nr:ankyrin repeat and EF-hand domain-containing 1 [Brachionus plicatilis]